MAALIGDFGLFDRSLLRSSSSSSTVPFRPPPPPSPTSGAIADTPGVAAHTSDVPYSSKTVAASNTSSRLPIPFSWSSPIASRPSSPSRHNLHPWNGNSAHMASMESSHTSAEAYLDSGSAVPSASDPSATSNDTVIPTPSAARIPPPTNAIPSPASDNFQPWMPVASPATSCPAHNYVPVSAVPPSPLPPPQRTTRIIRIRDLSHIENLAQLDVSTGNGPGILNDPPLQDIKFEISDMPISDIIDMVAALLTKITTTNDHQHDALNRNQAQQRQAQAHNDGANDIQPASPFSTSVLAFHGRNVPAITILSYLSRIHKYCPTTYEVFLSLLVYFDRMKDRVNDLVRADEETRRRHADQQRAHLQHLQQQQRQLQQSIPQSEFIPSAGDVPMHDGEEMSSQDDEVDESLADSDDDEGGRIAQIHNENQSSAHSTSPPASAPAPTRGPLTATYFVVDSYNIHRLIIAGVTCASKFFSDVFYTNSRYAKVGGLPLAELNHLELQFLILNDFRLAIPLEDLEAYATMLVEFYAREVVGKRPRPSGSV